MKILIGVLVALTVALGVVGYQLKSSLGRESAAWEQYRQASAALEVANAQNALLNDRFDSLDQALLELGQKQQINQADLTLRLATLKNIVQEPGDSDESVLCMRQPVPAQLDRWLRQ